MKGFRLELQLEKQPMFMNYSFLLKLKFQCAGDKYWRSTTVQNAVKMIRLHEMALHFDASLFLKRVLFKLQVGCNLWWSFHLDHKMFE